MYIKQNFLQILSCITQLATGSATAYNVTLNLTGHILMAIGISLYLLMYMWFEAINDGGYSSGGYGRSYGEVVRNKVRPVNIVGMITIVVITLQLQQNLYNTSGYGA